MTYRIYATTGDDVVRLTLRDARVTDVETVLASAGARCLAVDPRDPDRLYVGTFDNGLVASDDAGDSWRAAERGFDESRVLSVTVSLSDERSGAGAVYAGTEPSNLYRSEDRGRTWQRLPALRKLPSEPRWSFPPRPWTHHVRTIALHPTDPDQLTVGIELGGVMRSSDAGESWIDHNPQAHSDAHQIVTNPLAPDRLYEAAGQGIAISDDRGETWKRREQGLDRHYAWGLAADHEDPELWYVSVSRSPFAAHGDADGEARLLRSAGNGSGRNGDWVAIDAWGNEPALRRMPYALAALSGHRGRLLVGLRGGTLMLTDDAGETWSELDSGLEDVIDMAAVPVS